MPTLDQNGRTVDGAGILIEQKPNRPVLHVACRHHVYELVLEKALSTCLSVSSGRDIQLFKSFQCWWDLIERTTPEPFIADDIPERDEPLSNFCRFLDHSSTLTFPSGSSETLFRPWPCRRKRMRTRPGDGVHQQVSSPLEGQQLLSHGMRSQGAPRSK